MIWITWLVQSLDNCGHLWCALQIILFVAIWIIMFRANFCLFDAKNFLNFIGTYTVLMHSELKSEKKCNLRKNPHCLMFQKGTKIKFFLKKKESFTNFLKYIRLALLKLLIGLISHFKLTVYYVILIMHKQWCFL